MPPLEKFREVELLRRSLGSIGIADVPTEKEMSESERKAYVGVISSVWPTLEKDIKRFMYQQVLAIAESENWEKVNYGRGTCNGLSLLHDYWKQINSEFSQPKEKEFDKTNPMPEV